MSQKSACALFNRPKTVFGLHLTCPLVSGGGEAVVHRAERVDPCKLRHVVCWGVWGWWRLSEECSHGCSQGETAGKTLDYHKSHSIFSLYLLDKHLQPVVICLQRCEKCQKPGATVGCCLTSCTSNYHFMCARQCHCIFLEDKKVYCPKHRDLIKGEVSKCHYSLNIQKQLSIWKVATWNICLSLKLKTVNLVQVSMPIEELWFFFFFNFPFLWFCVLFFPPGCVWVWGGPQDPSGSGRN